MNILLKFAICLSAIVGGTAALAAPTAYIALGSGDQVVAVDAATNQIIKSYPGIDNPHGLVATPDGEYIVAGSMLETPAPGALQDAPNSKLFLIHTGHGHVMLTIPVSGWTHHLAITPDGRYVISTHPTRGGISIVDMQTNQVNKTVETGPAPNYTVVTRDGKHAYVTNSGNGTISEVDVPPWRVTRTLEGGPAPEHVVLSADENTLYTLNPRAGTVSAVSVATGKISQTYKIGANLHGLDISDDGQTLFITSVTENKLVALDLRTDAQRSLPLSPDPYHLNAIRGTGKVYISSRSAPTV